MMSASNELRGDAAGRNTSGAAPVTFADAGKAITRDSATLAFNTVEALQGSVVLAMVEVADAMVSQAPAVAAVVEGEAQHAQEAQPAASSAEEEQQQPPRHWLVPQSALEAQGSPGELSTQVPVPGLHEVQPCRAAFAEQQ